ncbi:delta-6 fatty acid desaturase [Chlamydoabsidia padenii]|nr:delta-6 fatty acid desaturase [Chlamydoabsidia padenii]
MRCSINVIIIDNKLYDVSEFYREHPGGARVLLTHIGKDASDVFHAMHPESAYEMLANHYLGDLSEADYLTKAKTSDKKAFAADMRQLRDQLIELGYFESNVFYYLYKVISTLSICMASMFILYLYGQQSTGAIVVSAFLLGLFWQQCGWLSHDFAHHQVFNNRPSNDMAVIFLGNFCQGFSLSWWKSKHNTHHASTNVDGHDPDIDTAPVIMWHEHASANYYGNLAHDTNNNNCDTNCCHKTTTGFKAGLDRFVAENILPYQTRYYFFVIALARMSWAIQSAFHVIKVGTLNKSLQAYELGCLVCHWTLFLTVTMRWIDGVQNRLLFVVLSQAFAGYMLALVFAMNHNGMPVISKEQAESMEFYEIQVVTGRNVKMGWLGTWFMGGLNYQIDHHVFPSLPRHHLATVQPMIEAICNKHQVIYHKTSFIQGTLESLKALDITQKVSRKLAMKYF